MGKPNYKPVQLPPIHEVSKIIPASEYWLRKNVLVGTYGVSSTTYVQCSCGKTFMNTEFENHLIAHGFISKHFFKATLHSRGGKIYSCDCGRTFKTVEDLAEHVNVSKREKATRLPTAFSAVGYITDDFQRRAQ